MSRTVAEWVGRNDDTPIPPRVKDRVLERQEYRCATCPAPFGPKVRPEFDHRLALINGGENREGNIQALCALCHAPKSKRDVAQKKKDASVRQAHHGIKTTKRKLPGAKDSPWKAKIGGGWVRRGGE